MQRNFSLPFYIVLTSFLFTSLGCFPWAKKAQVSTKQSPKTSKSKRITNPASIRDMEFLYANINSLDASGSVDVSLGDFDQEVNTQIRWIRDSVYWMNFSIIGIEGARLLITKDSLFLVDRINKEYYAERLEVMAKRYNVPISLSNVQAFLLGYPFFLSNETIKDEKLPGQIHFIQEDINWKADYYTDSTMTELYKMQINQKTGESQLSTSQEDFKTRSGFHKFAFKRLFDIYTKQIGKGHIRLDIDDLEINKPKEIKFSIPSSYERM